MTLRWLMALLHLLALPIGVAAVYLRAHALRALARGGDPAPAVSADLWWAIAAFLWIATGLYRYLGGLEKPASYYNYNWLFHSKMIALGLILLLEIRPIVVIGRWRSRLRKQQPIETAAADAMATTSYVQLLLAVLMMVAATGMARGIGFFG